MPFGFGLAGKTTRIALHAKFWLSPRNSEGTQELFSTTKLSQSSTEVKFGGRDKKGQAKSLVPNQSLVSSMLLGQSLLATANICICPGKIWSHDKSWNLWESLFNQITETINLFHTFGLTKQWNSKKKSMTGLTHLNTYFSPLYIKSQQSLIKEKYQKRKQSCSPLLGAELYTIQVILHPGKNWSPRCKMLSLIKQYKQLKSSNKILASRCLWKMEYSRHVRL